MNVTVQKNASNSVEKASYTVFRNGTKIGTVTMLRGTTVYRASKIGSFLGTFKVLTDAVSAVSK